MKRYNGLVCGIVAIIIVFAIIGWRIWIFGYDNGYDEGHENGVAEMQIQYKCKLQELYDNLTMFETETYRDEDVTIEFINEFIENADYYVFDFEMNSETGYHKGYMAFYYDSDYASK